MRWTIGLRGVVVAVLSQGFAQVAFGVVPFTEHFTTNHSNWTEESTAVFATHNAAGGPAPASSSYISALKNTAMKSSGDATIVFRGQNNLGSSGNAFTGNWLADGINHFSVYVYHEAPVALPFFVRFATTFAFPGTNGMDGNTVPPNTWTQLNFDIHPSQIDVTLFPETDDPMEKLNFFNQSFSTFGRFQVGFVTPAAMAMNTTSYKYAIDQVSITGPGVPEPTVGTLLMMAGSFVVSRRRRRAKCGQREL
jgi:hypothetical protein